MVAAVPDSAREARARGGVAAITEGDLENDPEDVAPFVAFLASDYAANINGQTFLVYGGQVSLMSQPRPERSIYNAGGWDDMDALSLQAREHLTKDIYNPAPLQPPRQ